MARERTAAQPAPVSARFLYRGVHAAHPALDQARRGVVLPGNSFGDVTPLEHNKGGISEASQFTSWTYEREVAEFHACKFGPGGVVLELLHDTPNPGDLWAWEASPDLFDEQEVLLRGIRTGATVIPI
jgi:hypothetical protein